MPTISLHPTPVLSDAKTSPPRACGEGIKGSQRCRRVSRQQATGVWGKSTWNKGLNVIVDTNGKMPIPQEHKIRLANMQRQIFLPFIY
ncbi:hypothetical protein NIES4073_09440 [Kalymmatonema gypsitolerans NIES-4073]|nr:hypothetical protein NIES4073_09440 [Scytonema sp. NIES-4073]